MATVGPPLALIIPPSPPPLSSPLPSNLVLVDEAGSKLWVKVSEGKEVGPNSMPFCGRIDVALDAEPQKEARWLLLVTKEIDYVSRWCCFVWC